MTQTMSELPDDYLYATARNIGVPKMFMDDAVQEMRLALWRKPETWPIVAIRNACIDFLRRMVNDKRTNPETPNVIALENMLHYPVAISYPSDDWMDAQTRLAKFSERERRILIYTAMGYNQYEIGKMVGCNNTRVCQILKKVQKELAA